MTTKSETQTYLGFLARLYELASQYEPATLRLIRRYASSRGDQAALLVINALSQLTERSVGNDVPKAPTNTDLTNREIVFRDALMSRELFPSVDAIANSLSGHFNLPPRPKESRERYVKRLVAAMKNVAPDRRSGIESAIRNRIAHVPNADFVSRWSKLIRNL
jgi:hypothetical protein